MRGLLLGLLLAAAAFMCFRNAADCVADADLGWHLQTASWILQHRALPHVDPFSSTRSGQPWQAYSWIFELALAKAYSWMGLGGVVLFTAGWMMLIAAALYRMTSRLQADFSIRILLSLAALFCISKLGMPRPWLITVLLFAVEIDLLMRSRETGSSRPLLWLPMLFAFWSNVHIQFIDGLLVLGIAACEPILLRWWSSPTARPAPARNLWLALAASIAAACLNPYGAEIYRVAWQLGSQSGVLTTVSEMGALPFRSAGDFVLLFMALAAAGILFRYRRLALFETVLLAMAAVLSFRSRRDVWIMAISAAAILAAGLPAREESRERSFLPGWALGISAVAAIAVAALSMFGLQVNNAGLEKQLAERMPVQAVEFVRQQHEPGPVFNTYDWGGFLIWRLQEPVSIDGRAALYGDARIDRSVATWNGGPGWASDPALLASGLVMAPRGMALVQLLRGDPRFSVAYEDKLAVVFIRRSSHP